MLAEIEDYGQRVKEVDTWPCSKSRLLMGCPPYSPENYKIRNADKAWGTRSMINALRRATEEVSVCTGG